jgi:DNA modification methylase
VTPYFQDEYVTIYHGDCRDILPTVTADAVVVSDPPYNVGYHYDGYSDSLSSDEYLTLLQTVMRMPSVMLHYPESIAAFCARTGWAPTECVSWVYHANTPRQWRQIAWFGATVDFARVTQPYMNPHDKRVMALMAAGKMRSLYDWWHIEQVKNVSDEKTEHPCQIPVAVMERVLGITPHPSTVLDPFMGSGTTLVAAKRLGRRAIGIELNQAYCDIAIRRLAQSVLPLEQAPAPVQAAMFDDTDAA